jgi:hypothetical protein
VILAHGRCQAVPAAGGNVLTQTQSAPCIWCGQGKRTKEHVLPNWLRAELRRALGDDVIRITGLHHLAQGGKTPLDWEADPFTLAVNAVCKDCNNNWSAQLENRTKPYLQKLIAGGDCQVDRAAQAIIAA